MSKYNPDIHHRRSIRLRGYDYSQRGHYFITICTQNGMCLFGEIENGEIQLNDAGRMILYWYSELENKFQEIRCDAFICMSNHIHFILYNGVGADLCVRPCRTTNDSHYANPNGRHDTNPNNRPDNHPNNRPNVSPDEFRGKGQADPARRGEGRTHRSAPTPPPPPPPTTIGTVAQWFKTMTTNEYIRGVKQNAWAPFPGKLWQRNYWEHIVRNDDELQKIRDYIINNPKNWFNDKLNGGIGNIVMESLDPYNHQSWMV